METTNEIGSLYKNVSAFTAPFSLHSCNQTKVQSSNEIIKIELLPSVNMQEWYCSIWIRLDSWHPNIVLCGYVCSKKKYD